MTWWAIVLLCFVCYWLGIINGTVMERERYIVWMSNSWEMLTSRLWWVNLMEKDKQNPTIEDLTELTTNLSQTLADYRTIFSRPYLRETPIESEAVSTTQKEPNE